MLKNDQLIGERIVELRTRQKMPPDIVAEAARMSTEDYLKGERPFSAHELYFIARTKAFGSPYAPAPSTDDYAAAVLAQLLILPTQ